MAGFNINQVVLSGNLTRDPELASTPQGQDVCRIGLAVNDRVKKDGNWTDRSNYFRVTVWGGMGKWLGQNLKKGDGVVVAGRLRWHQWESEGKKREAVDVIANSVVPQRRGSSGEPQQASMDEGDIPF